MNKKGYVFWVLPVSQVVWTGVAGAIFGTVVAGTAMTAVIAGPEKAKSNISEIGSRIIGKGNPNSEEITTVSARTSILK